MIGKVTFYLITLLLFILSGQAGQAGTLDSLENQLNREMVLKQTYDAKKKLKIEAHKELISKRAATIPERFRYLLNIAEEFDKFSFDSTLLYIERSLAVAEQMDSPLFTDEARLFLCRTLSNAGRTKEAEDVLKLIDPKNYGRPLFLEYCNTARKLYEDLSFYAINRNNQLLYLDQYNFYKDTLLQMVDKDSEIYLSIREKDLLDERALEKCLDINSRRLAKTYMGTAQYSLVTFQRSLIYELMGKTSLQKQHLMLSAISDIRTSNKDNASLAVLAVIIFREGQIAEAYKYIEYAFQDAVQFNSRLRFFEISQTMSMITAAYQQISIKQRDRLQFNLVIISILGVILLITLIYIFRQVRKLSAARAALRSSVAQLNDANAKLTGANRDLENLNLDLSEANHVKEQYIASFLTIHSDYIEKIDKHQKLVKNMIRGRKIDKLLDLMSSPEYIDSEVKDFYATFDNAFISIYPTFITELNKLLKPDQQIKVKEDEILNTELRIFALIRLGIKDSSNIARLLRYSVNTIYNYRVKIKNRAIVPRDDFEDLIKKIGVYNKEIT